jgi:hypothetical protein
MLLGIIIDGIFLTFAIRLILLASYYLPNKLYLGVSLVKYITFTSNLNIYFYDINLEEGLRGTRGCLKYDEF